MQFFTVEQLGPKQSLTPEGFLVCHDVPIARTGEMQYTALELPQLEANAHGVITIERTPEEVFRAETMASFEGKPVTLDHPYEPVTPENWRALAKGVAKHVRRGESAQQDLLLADLLITDQQAIEQVRAGLREVSCGYQTDYEQISLGRGVLRRMVGNHIALVKRGRCGTRCSIGDRHMADNTSATRTGRPRFAEKLRKFFMTRDSEEFEKTLETIQDEGAPSSKTEEGQHIHVHLPTEKPPPESKKPTEDEPEQGSESKLLAAIEAIDARLKALEAKLEAPKTETKQQTADDAPELKSSEMVHDSAALREAFQEAIARAEILAPGVKLPTLDTEASQRSATDALCALRRRALTAALQNDHADIVRMVAGDKAVSTLTCDAAQAVFNAASELVKQKNLRVTTPMTRDAKLTDLNQLHADFWASH